MSYNPKDHAVTPKQAHAGWIVCIGIISFAFAFAGGRHEMAAATDDLKQAETTTRRCPMSSIRLPSLADGAPEREGAEKLAQGQASVPRGHCG
jgi:hypothetical protein